LDSALTYDSPLKEACVDDRVRDLMDRAVALARKEDFGPEAERINRQLVDLLPLDIRAKNRLAQILEARGEKREAIALCEDVLRLDPGNSIAGRRLRELQGSRPGPPVGGHTRRGPKRSAVEPVSVGGIDPASESDAAAVIRGLYPDDAELRACLTCMAAAIKQVNHLPPEYWMITLQPRKVVLNISKLTAVSFLRGSRKATQYVSRLSLLAEMAKVPTDIRELAFAVSGELYQPPRIASHLNWIELPADRVDALLQRCEAAHRAAVDEASQWGKSPFLSHHSRGVVAFLNTVLGERIVGI
jgi:hypothetical protein